MSNDSLMLVVVVPAFNEGDRITDTVRALRSTLHDLPVVDDSRVYVVDDGSADMTGNLAEEAGADRVIRHQLNQGLGAAVRTGLEAAYLDGADIAVKFDADLQHDPADIAALVQPILDDEADVVYGNRFERIEYRMPIGRRLGNFLFTRLMRWLTGWNIIDAQPGILAVDRVYLEQFHLPGDYNYTQQILLDAYHKGMRFATVPVTFRKRETGRSFISIKYPFKVLPQIFWMTVGLRPMRVFGALGLLLMATAAGVAAWEFSRFVWGDGVKPIEHVNVVLGTSLAGLQTFFFGVIAQLIVWDRRRR